MSFSDPAAPTPAISSCPICGGMVIGDPGRCSACGFIPEGGPGQPSPFRGSALGLLVGLFVGLYVTALAAVLAAR